MSEKHFTTDFDYIYKNENNDDGGKTLPELTELVEKHNGKIENLIENGEGGGNPQFFVKFPSKDKFVEFFVELWGKEFYNEYFGFTYGEVK